jgi:hypothetical protein
MQFLIIYPTMHEKTYKDTSIYLIYNQILLHVMKIWESNNV